MHRAARGFGVFLLATALFTHCGGETATRSATAPRLFPQLTTRSITVGTTSLSVVVADTEVERTQGFRGRTTFGPWAGMLFEYSQPVITSFTMATVSVALDIGFYNQAGDLVDQLAMSPCLVSDNECPVYRSARPFRYALETLAGQLPAGSLQPDR